MRNITIQEVTNGYLVVASIPGTPTRNYVFVSIEHVVEWIQFYLADEPEEPAHPDLLANTPI